MEPEGLNPRNTVRGRPRKTYGSRDCARCGKPLRRVQATWPEGTICFPCWFVAIHTHGECPHCGIDRLLPGPADQNGRNTCGPCAGIVDDFHCGRCGAEAGHHRKDLCARCALRDDLHTLLDGTPTDPTLVGLVDALCSAGRPESILIWKRSPKVQYLLRSLGDGSIAPTHEGLDGHPGRATEHLRALLQHHGLLPYRDPWLPVFEQWLQTKFANLPDEVRKPVERFAVWHHLRRIREIEASGGPTRPSIRAAKQEITETTKFLSWLHATYQRTAAECTQHDIDEWVAGGPTTRTAIRTFVVKTLPSFTRAPITMEFRMPKTTPTISQEQRLAWIRELLVGTSESLQYRVAGVLILLYAQPLKRIAVLRTDAVDDDRDRMTITFGKHPVDVPEPFAALLHDHLRNRPNLRTGSDASSPWFFPGNRAGDHVHVDTIMHRLRQLGISNLGGRNRALDELVIECPPPIVADALNYSYEVATKHAANAGEPWARYAGRRTREP